MLLSDAFMKEVSPLELDPNQLASLFPNISAQMRGALSNLYLAASQLIDAEAREHNPALDAKAAVFDQSYYRLLRLVTSLSSAEYLVSNDPFTLQDADLVALVSQACESSSDTAEMLGIYLKFLCAMDRHICAIYPPAIEQLLYHLLSNALKFTPRGGTVTVELKKSQERILLCVEDTGCGIAPEQMDTLFEGYLRRDCPQPPPHGLGLGLPLCQRIAQLHGGSIMAQSTVGKGSRFTVYLPDRQLGGQVSDVQLHYAGGFNRTLLGLADALPAQAFSLRNQD